MTFTFSSELIDLLCSPAGRAEHFDVGIAKKISSANAAFFPVEAANRAGVLSDIESAVKGSDPITDLFLNKQAKVLGTFGFSAEVASGTVALILARSISSLCRKARDKDDREAALGNQIELDYDPFEDVEDFGQYLIRAFDCLLCNLCGGITEDAAIWLLNIAADTGNADATALRETAALAAQGNENAIRQLVDRGYESWATYAAPTVRADLGFHADSLGLTYQLMCRLQNDSSIKLRLGLLLWEFGHAGEEDKGIRMIVESALAGNKGAWLTIKRLWCDDGNSVIDQLLSAGAARATIEDIDPDPETRYLR